MSTISSYSPVTTSGQITFSGLGNGTDFNQLITKLVQVEQTRIKPLQTWKQSWTKKQTAFDELSTELISLKTTLEGMDTVGEFLTKVTDSTNSSVLSATTGTDAVDGSHSITVARLATAKAMVTDTGYSSSTANINSTGSSQTFAYTYKGVTYSNSVGADCTLTDLCSIINNDASNPGVKASVVYDGSKYYMQLRGMDTGDSASLVVASGTSLTGFTASDFDTISTNASAQLKLDGWPTASNAYITRETNTVTDLLSGLTLNLKSTGTVTTTTSTDTDAVKEHIQTFVEQVNAVRTLIKEITDYDSSTSKASILTGNYGVQLIDSNLKTAIASIGIGFDRDEDTYCVLSQLGIFTDATEGSKTEGLLYISNATLNTALSTNPDAVAKLFSGQYLGSTSTNDFTVSSYVTGLTKCGTYEVAYTCDSAGKITGATINGHTAVYHSNSNLITGAAGYDESGLVIKVLDTTAGSHTGTASLKEGKAPELVDLLDQMTDSTDGPLAILDKNYDDITAMIDDKIAYEQQRISNYAYHLRIRFAKTDSLLSTYAQMQSSLTSYIDKLNSD
jgi:flagellar hook-associated protein 2